jgi:hypothetical protein
MYVIIGRQKHKVITTMYTFTTYLNSLRHTYVSSSVNKRIIWPRLHEANNVLYNYFSYFEQKKSVINLRFLETCQPNSEFHSRAVTSLHQILYLIVVLFLY